MITTSAMTSQNSAGASNSRRRDAGIGGRGVLGGERANQRALRLPDPATPMPTRRRAPRNAKPTLAAVSPPQATQTRPTTGRTLPRPIGMCCPVTDCCWTKPSPGVNISLGSRQNLRVAKAGVVAA